MGLEYVGVAAFCGFLGGCWPFCLVYLIGRRQRRRQAEAFVARIMQDQP